jgi:tRNA A37 threonylcarbamoyladenosine dehydratase
LGALSFKLLTKSKDGMLCEFVTAALSNSVIQTNAEMTANDPGIAAEQFIRNEQFFGESGQALVRQGRVIVVGVGGVGSHCAVTLGRSGVQHLRVIDFDRVTVASLNRHASAVRSEVGIAKVQSLKRFISAFNPDCEVDAVEALFNYDSAEELIAEYKPDWVVDAIDNLNTKADLLAYCHEKKIKVVCACGSAAKCDPTRIRISTIENSSEDPLARAIRQKLRILRGLSNTGIPVVYSTERTTRGLLPLKDFQEDNPTEFQTLDKFRVRILPVIAPLPVIMGNAIASYILCQLAEQPFTPLTTAPAGSASHRKKLWNFVRRNFSRSGPQLADSGDADVVLDTVFDACSGRSILSGDAGNLCLVPYRFEVDRFNPSDLVLMTTTEAKGHVAGEKLVIPPTWIQPVTERIRRELIENGIGNHVE